MKQLLVALFLFFSAGAFAQDLDTLYAIDPSGETVALVFEKGNEPVIPEGMRLIEFRLGNEDKIVTPEIITDEAEIDSIAYYQNLIDLNNEKDKRYNNTGNILLGSSGAAFLLGTMMLVDAINGGSGGLGILEAIGGLCLEGVVLPLGVAGLIFKLVGSSKGGDAAEYQRNLDSYKQKNSVVKLDIVPVVNPVNRTIGGNFALVF